MFLRRVARPLMMMAKVKETTGIVGLDVVPNAREVLIGLYTKTLEEIKQVPKDEGYRKAVESFTSHRLKVCQEEKDWESIESKLGCGQVEELIEEAQDELKLIGHMVEWNPWDIPDDYECEVIENDAPVPKHVPLHRPGPLPEEFYKTLAAVDTGTLEDVIASSKKEDPAISLILINFKIIQSADLEKKAKEAFIDDRFELAIDLYSQAIALTPNDADLYADRAQANIKLRNFSEAVADADKAIELDPSISKAYLRKGMACIKIEEYKTAKTVLEKGASLAPGDARFTNLIKECDQHIAEEAEELPKVLAGKASTDDVTPNNLGPAGGLSSSEEAAQFNMPKYRHGFYQKPEEVVVTIFAKGIPANYVAIDFGAQILRVTIEVPGEEAYHFQPRLFGKVYACCHNGTIQTTVPAKQKLLIIPSKCRYEVMSTEIEIRLAKADSTQWPSLEYRSDVAVVQKVQVPSGNQKPTYPSSKPKRVDWDKLEAQVKKEEKDEKLDGDAALNKFFRDIYKDADEDATRAMQKSFVESNGTVLSTNWDEVGSKKVEGSAPDGMELKKWEY